MSIFGAEPNYEISIGGLTYKHSPIDSPSLSNVSMKLPKGSRTILVGANGGTDHNNRSFSLG